MQVSIYVSVKDYETLSTAKPAAETVTKYITEILREKALALRSMRKLDGTPIVPQYERQ